MYYQNTNNFNYSNPIMESYYRSFDHENWTNQIQFASSYQHSPENISYVHEPLLNQDVQPADISELSSPYQDQYHSISCNVAQPSVISPSVEAFTAYSYIGSPANQNNPFQYSPVYQGPTLKPDLHVPKPHLNNNIMAKKHRAQISLVSSSTGTIKAIVKRKRKRTVFTTEQVAALEEIFSKKPYVTREDRQVLVQRLQINDKAIKIWFQNRRLKGKKAPEENTEPEIESVLERVSPVASRLDYVQSQIIEKTDEFGFVTLDDRVMGDLADVIDNFLTDDIGLSTSGEEMTDDGSSPLYEPISPASTIDRSHEEESSTWKPSEPNESLQRLFDLQTLLTL